MPRPQLITDDDELVFASCKPRSKLQAASLRRAVVDRIVDAGGSATIRKLNRHFNFETRTVVLSLVRSGWLKKKERHACNENQ